MKNNKIENNFPKYREAEKRINHKIAQAAAMEDFYKDLDLHQSPYSDPHYKAGHYFHDKRHEWGYKKVSRQNQLEHAKQSFMGNITSITYPKMMNTYFDPATGEYTGAPNKWGQNIPGINLFKNAKRKKNKEMGRNKEEAKREHARQVSIDPW